MLCAFICFYSCFSAYASVLVEPGHSSLVACAILLAPSTLLLGYPLFDAVSIEMHFDLFITQTSPVIFDF